VAGVFTWRLAAADSWAKAQAITGQPPPPPRRPMGAESNIGLFAV